MEPSFPAWVQVADSIFVGTVDATHRVDSPIHLHQGDQDLGPVDIPECDGGNVDYAMTVTFRDVETLHGEQLPPSFTIRMGRGYADGYPGVSPREDGALHDGRGTRVYAPGARVGAALFTDNAGNYHWEYRQFLVVDDVIHLQELDAERYLGCSMIPMITQIPDTFEGASLSEFKSAITQAAQVPLTEEQQLAIGTWHSKSRYELAAFKLGSQTYCHAPVGGGNNTTGANNRAD